MKPMNRRAFIAGSAKTIIALPLLEAMFLTDKAMAQAASTMMPRFSFMYFANGVVEFEGSPTSMDKLTGILAPLAPYRQHLVAVNGLSNRENSSWDQTGGPIGGLGTPHETEAATFLTCSKLGSLGELRVNPSIDQIIGMSLQNKYSTKTSALVIGAGDALSGIGQGDVNMAYHTLMSWKSATQYVAPFMTVNAVFKEMFSSAPPTTTNPDLVKLQNQKKSILDAALSQISSMRTRLGTADQVRLDQYLTGVRDVEKKVNAIVTTGPACPTVTAPQDYNPGDSGQFESYIRTMIDLITISFQCNLIPVANFMFTRGNGGARSGVGGVPDDQHEVSHYADDTAKKDKLRKINTFYYSMFAYYLKKLNETMELDQPMIKNILSLYGCSTSDAQLHDGSNATIMLAGGQNLGVVTNRVLDYGLIADKPYGTGKPLANLFLGMSNVAGVGLTKFANSNAAINLKA